MLAMANAATPKTRAKNELITALKKLGETQGLNNAFTTFLELTATSICASCSPIDNEKHERRYLELESKMTPDTVKAYAHLTALLFSAICEHWDDPCDILGSVYHELRLNNEWNGQFFTPDYICRMMGTIINPTDEASVGEKGYMTIGEPACGSGAMIIGAVWSMLRNNFDYQQKSFFVAHDIDIRCVWMAYIQLSLYKIPALVIHGNSLTDEEWSRWYTPCAAIPLSKSAQNNSEVEYASS